MTSHLEKMEADLNICDDGGDRLREEGYKCSKIRNLLREIDIKCSKIESTLEPSEQLYERLEIIERIKNQESIFPHAALRRVITPDLVRELLPGHGAAVDNMANAICSSFCAILGILAKMERTQDIEKFVKAGVDDSYLPIIPPTGTEVPVSNGKSIEIQDWKRRRWDIFDKFQSCFLSPFFARPGGTIYHFRLTNSRQKPPILEQDETESWEDESDGPLSESLSGSSFGILADIVSHNAGAHGSVKKVRLDALSHNFGDFPFRNADDWYAQKELYPLATPDISWKAFVREAYIWARVCKAMKQFNIHQAVTLLCTYEMEVNGRSRFYFISPWATGNLMGLWRTNPSGGDLIKFTDRWMIKQCKDMTEFLSCLHANAAEDSEKFSVPPDQEEPIFMRHGDIKPENILWYADYPGCLDGGALVLGDFGISKAHRRSTKSFSNPVNTKHTETYAAPEFAVKGRQHTIGRASDLWSSACTWLNFATWFVWGIQGVRDFAEERDEQDPNEATFSDDRFFRLTNNNVKAEVKPKVLNWVKRIRKEKKCTPLVEAFIGIAMDDMLVVDGKKRATALEISRKLEYLLK